MPLILWLNEHLGPLAVHSQGRGRPITEAKCLREARDRILGTVLSLARTKATFGKDVEEMLRQPLTFGEAIAGFDLMPAPAAIVCAMSCGRSSKLCPWARW